MRVYELARSIGIPTSDLLAALADESPDAPRSASAKVPTELESAIRERFPATDAARDNELHRAGTVFIRQAFEIARLSEKPGWQEMSSAVLKNRILDLTARRFDETFWGVSSFQEWLELFSDTVEIDHARKPPWVRLLNPGQVDTQSEATGPAPRVAAAADLPRRWRIRSDLWKAVTDVARAGDWFWDGVNAELLPVHPSGRTGYVPVPTFTREELSELRRSYRDQGKATGTDQQLIDTWISEQLPDSVLPTPLRGRWTALLKEAVLARLRGWFASTGSPEPTDLVQEPGPTRLREDTLDDLRSLVVRCVQVMTRAELEELRLPPAAVLRSTRR